MPDFRMFYEYSMTLRELLQSVDAEAYASIPLYEKLLKTKPEYGSSNRIKVKVLTSRPFNGMISDKDTLRTHIANYAARCAEKLRMQNTVAPLRNLSHDYLLHAFGESHVSADALCSQLGIIAVEADKRGVWESCSHLFEWKADDDGRVETYTKLQ